MIYIIYQSLRGLQLCLLCHKIIVPYFLDVILINEILIPIKERVDLGLQKDIKILLLCLELLRLVTYFV